MRRLLAGSAVLLLLGVPAAAQAVTPPPVPSAPGAASTRLAGVLVIGVGGLRWDDVGPSTPTLRRLARTAAVGALSVKARSAGSCAADGWLTLGAGTRADAFDDRRPCAAGLRHGRDLVARNADTVDGARLAALGQSLDGRFEASGPGARLALGGPGRAGQPVVVVDAGTLDDADRASGLEAADAVVADALSRLPDAVDLLVVGVSEATGETDPHLHVALATGPSFPRGALRSASTRRSPYVQLIDVAPTVLTLLGEPVPEVVDGQPWTVSGAAPSVAELVDLDRRAQGMREATVPFFVVLLAVPLGLLVALWRRPRASEVVALAGTAGLGASYVANLLPWWRAGVPLLGLLAAVVPVSVAVALLARSPLALARTARPIADADRPPAAPGCRPTVATPDVARPAQLVCALTAAVLLLDLLTGAHLQMSSVGGYSPLVAGRFAGIGNVAFGVLAASVLLAAAASRRAVVLTAVGLLTVAVDGAPPFGSDVGGVLALVPAFALLALLRTRTRVTVGRLVLAVGAGVGVVTAFALADWSRPAADRTHLGRFVQDVLDGTAGALLSRKASAGLDLLLHSPVTAALPLVVAAAVYLVVRPPPPLAAAFDRAPAWRHGLLAVGAASLLGFALNDSGAAVPALALCVVLPATVAVVTRERARGEVARARQG